MNLLQCLVVLRKELTDGIRERKAVGMVLATAILTPLVYIVISTIVASERQQAEDLVLPVGGAQHAPALVDWLRQQDGVDVVPAPADPEKAIRDRTADVILIIEKDFSGQMSRAVPAIVKVMRDTSRSDAAPKAARVRDLINRYGGEVTSLRMLARGIAPSVATPVRVDEVEVSSLQQRLAGSLFVVPIFLAVVAFMGAMPMAIDLTAGERERDSLEPLLLNPMSAATAVTGKWLAASVFGAAGVLVCALFTVGAFRLVPWHDLGMRFPLVLSGQTVVRMLLLYLPLTLLMSALTMCMSTFSRSHKEAQSLTTLLIPAPMIPLIVTIFMPLSNQPWLAPVPVVGQFALTLDILAGASPSALSYALAALTTIATAFALVVFAARLFRRESIVFG